MVSRDHYSKAKQMALDMFVTANIPITEDELSNIEVSDFGLNDLFNTGLQLITYINTSRVCSKEMVLFSRQTCPEHRHPAIDDKEGKEETFRCKYGTVYLYVEGQKQESLQCTPPAGTYTVFHEIILNAGDQYTIFPGTKHWFQGGKEGAVISEFSTHSDDNSDIFTDEKINRIPVYQ